MSRSEPVLAPAVPVDVAEPVDGAELGDVAEPVDVAELAGHLERLAARARALPPEPAAGVTEQDLRRLLSAAIRLYAAVSEQAARDIVPIDAEVSTTDAVVLACALLKARDLNPFDLALWFSRTRTAG
jgi:hypothetical protein